MKTESTLFGCFRKSMVLLTSCVALTGAGRLATAAESDTATRLLFDGQTLQGWRKPTGDWTVGGSVALDPANSNKFVLTPGGGVLVNGAAGKTVNLLSEFEHGDVEAHIEFCLPSRSNSGIYFMGRYEVQVYDSYGVTKDKYPGIECAGIYPRWTAQRGEFEGHSPRINASRPPGEWQTFDVVFRAPRFGSDGRKTQDARFVKVMHNGVVVHENVAISGPTRAAHFEDEKSLGPLQLQGDHGPIAYRALQLKSIRLD